MRAHKPRRVIIWTAKGGVGKTSTAVNLAASLAAEGDRVLLLDIDHQANASLWLDAEGRPTLYEVATNSVSLPSIVHRTAVKGIDIVPASEMLAGLETVLRQRVGAELWLRRQLATLPDRWDWIIADAGPGLGLLNVGMLAAADQVLAPVEASVLSLAGVQRLLDTVSEVRGSLNEQLALLGVLPVRVDRRMAVTAEALSELTEALGEQLMRTRVPIDVRMVEAPGHRMPIGNYAPNCRATHAFRQLAQEVRERWE